MSNGVEICANGVGEANRACACGCSSGSGIQRDDATRIGETRNVDARPLEAVDVEMNAEDPCAAQVNKRAKT